MSAKIRQERAAYYDILEETQKRTLDITPWMEWFLGCLGRAIDGAQTTLGAVLDKAHFWERVQGSPSTSGSASSSTVSLMALKASSLHRNMRNSPSVHRTQPCVTSCISSSAAFWSAIPKAAAAQAMLLPLNRQRLAATGAGRHNGFAQIANENLP
jgi:hypothetical protein